MVRIPEHTVAHTFPMNLSIYLGDTAVGWIVASKKVCWSPNAGISEGDIIWK